MGHKLNLTQTSLHGVQIINPIAYKDSRGEFSRIYCENELNTLWGDNKIKQVNHSLTFKRGTFRGLHFQYMPDCEIKMIKCLRGKILDIVVDIRNGSPTFLKFITVELSRENERMIFIPKGCAHGFQVLDDDSELIYFHSEIYSIGNEGALNIKDPLLNIELPLAILEISDRDLSHDFIKKDFMGI